MELRTHEHMRTGHMREWEKEHTCVCVCAQLVFPHSSFRAFRHSEWIGQTDGSRAFNGCRRLDRGIETDLSVYICVSITHCSRKEMVDCDSDSKNK